MNRQREVQFSIFETILSLKVDILLIQEPYTPKIEEKYLVINHTSYFTILPKKEELAETRPRIISYISKTLQIQFIPRYDIFNDPNLQAIDIVGNKKPFRILNIYNKKQ